MLVKRDNPIFGLFDADSSAEDTDPLWPEDDLPPPPAVEPSGYRPAPKGIFDSAEESEPEASGGVATPRAVAWTSEHLSDGSPLPVVTATTEPTQRGLGIPPPPSSRDTAWLRQMPSLTSVPPLALDAFDERVRSARTSARASEKASAEPSENERITVRAPSAGGMGARQRRRAFAVSLLAAAALLGGLFARRATLDSGRASTAMARATPISRQPSPVTGPVALPGAVVEHPSEPALPPPAGNAAPALPSSGIAAQPDGTSSDTASRLSEPSHESRREKRRRLRRENAMKRAAATTDVAAWTPPTSAGAPGGIETNAPGPHPTLSLPPR
jgi:hypothetical protein